MKSGTLVLALVMGVVAPSVAFADEQTTQSPDEQNAQSLSDRAYDAYQKNDFAKAVELYMASYKLVPTADILYNVASIYDKKLNESHLAVEFYRRYNAAPDAKPDLVGKSTARIAALTAEGEPGAGSGGDGSSESGSSRSSDGKKIGTLGIVGLATGAVGVVGVGVGVVAGLVASSDHHGDGCSGSTCETEAGRNTEKNAATLGNLSTVGFVAGGILLAGGVTLFFLAPKEKTTGIRSVEVSPHVAYQGGGLSVVGRF